MRVFLDIAYDGTDFFGSQIQKEIPQTILGEITSALLHLKIDSKVIASGRTDKGVHAFSQICHIELPSFWTNLDKLQTALNKIVPPAIRIKKIYKVDNTLHARYSAKKRAYRYILQQKEPNPFESRYVAYYKDIDLQKIKENIKLFEGTHDFSYFIKQGSDTKTNVRTIYKAYLYNYRGKTILYFEANGFLRTQIRFMVGALLSLEKEQIQQQLSLEKKYKFKPAQSCGLYLAKVKY